MTREHFHEQLERVELQLLSMGELASTAVQRSVEALIQHDDEAAERVIRDDDPIDDLYLEIDHDVLEMLALQSPVASQLRLVSAILHSCLHLERIADQAVNVAKLYLATRDLPPSQTLMQQLDEMGSHVVNMIRTVMEALRTRDLELCFKLPKMDDPVDRLNRATHLEALKLADDPRALDWGLHMNLAARALERVGDNAEQVGFLITGEFREFTDASHDVPDVGAQT
jgi:phosphate transport system protein